MTAQDFKTINSAEEGSATHLDYMIGLTSYEEAVNSSEKGRVLTSALRKEASVEEVSEFRCVENRGIWWPAWLYEQVEGEKIASDKRYVFHGKGVGIIRSENNGYPTGSIRMEGVTKQVAKHIIQLGNTDDELRE